MLVLTRRLSERVKETDIVITCPNGDIIKICLAQIKGKQVRIGVKTPSLAYIIDRAENYEIAKAARDNCPNRAVTTPEHANHLIPHQPHVNLLK